MTSNSSETTKAAKILNSTLYCFLSALQNNRAGMSKMCKLPLHFLPWVIYPIQRLYTFKISGGLSITLRPEQNIHPQCTKVRGTYRKTIWACAKVYHCQSRLQRRRKGKILKKWGINRSDSLRVIVIVTLSMKIKWNGNSWRVGYTSHSVPISGNYGKRCIFVTGNFRKSKPESFIEWQAPIILEERPRRR